MRLALIVLTGCFGCAGAASSVPIPSAPARHHKLMAVHTWPAPTRLPELAPHVRSTLPSLTMVIPQLGPPRSPAATKAERDRLTRVAARSKGATRLAALDRLADALEADVEDNLEDFVATAQPAVAAYLALIAEPGFAAYVNADQVMFRAARLLFEVGRTAEATDVANNLLAKGGTLDADTHVLLADNAKDPMLARHHYEEAMAIGRRVLADYARLRHITALTQAAEYQGALDDALAVAATSQLLRQPAAEQAVRAFAEIGPPSTARAFFMQLDPDEVDALLRRLARAYLELGKDDHAIAVLDELLATTTDPEAMCTTFAWIFEARVRTGRRNDQLAAARNLSDAAQHAPVCRIDADEMLGEVAWTWQAELPKSESDPKQVDAMWQYALTVVTTDARRAVALRDRAYLVWQLAETQRRFDAAGWDRAAAALQAAYDAGPDPELATAIAQAHANAATLRTSP